MLLCIFLGELRVTFKFDSVLKSGIKLYISLNNEMEGFMRPIAERFKALSDPNRLRILMMLKTKPLCVCEISAILRLANSTVSKHLSILRQAGFIVDEKDGRWVNYRLATAQESPEAISLLPQISTWLGDENLIQSDQTKLVTIDRVTICQVD